MVQRQRGAARRSPHHRCTVQWQRLAAAAALPPRRGAARCGAVRRGTARWRGGAVVCGAAAAARLGRPQRSTQLTLTAQCAARARRRRAPPAPSPPHSLRATDSPADMEHFIETVRKYPCLWNTTAIEYRDQELKDAAWAEVMKETDLSSVKEVKLKWKKLRDSYRDALKRQTEMLAKDPSNTTKKNYPWKYMGLMQFLQPYMSNRKKPAESAGFAAATHDAQDTHDTQDGHDNGHAHAQHTNGDAHSSDSDSSEAESSPKRKSCERLTVIDRKLDYLCKAQNKRHCPETQYVDRKRASPPTPQPPPPPPPPPPPAPPPLDPLDIFFNSMCQSTKRFPFPAQIKIKKTLFNAVIEAEEALVAEQQNYASLWAQEAGSSSSSDADDEDRKPSA